MILWSQLFNIHISSCAGFHPKGKSAPRISAYRSNKTSKKQGKQQLRSCNVRNESQDEIFDFEDDENGSSGGNMATPTIACIRYLYEAHSSLLNVIYMLISLCKIALPEFWNVTMPSSAPD